MGVCSMVAQAKAEGRYLEARDRMRTTQRLIATCQHPTTLADLGDRLAGEAKETEARHREWVGTLSAK